MLCCTWCDAMYHAQLHLHSCACISQHAALLLPLQVRSFGLPLVTWTIDEAQHMDKSVAVGTHLGISNTPLRYRQVLHRIQEQRQEQEQQQDSST
jgi:hypothetical protein